MTTPLPTVTVVHDGVQSDVAVPAGVTVGQLLAGLTRGTSPRAVRLAAGRAVSPLAVVGRDVPAASVLVAITPTAGPVSAAPAGTEAGARVVAWPAWIAAVGCLTVALVAVVGPLALGRAVLPTPLRWLAITLGLALTIVLARGTAARSPGWALGLPGLVGLSLLGLLAPASPYALRVGTVVALNMAFLAAVARWLRGRDAVAATAAVAWGGAALIGFVAGLGAWPLDRVAVAVLAGVSLILCLVPQLALRVEEQELVDTPLLAVSAATVHLPEMMGPSRIVARRTERTVADSRSVADTVTLAVSVGAVAAACLLPPLLVPGLEGWCALAAAACATLILWLVPMADQSPLARIAPRVAAVAVAVLTLRSAAGLWPLWAVAAVVPAAILGNLGLALYQARREGRFSPALGWVADIARTLACVAVAPTALVATGLFRLVWEMAS